MQEETDSQRIDRMTRDLAAGKMPPEMQSALNARMAEAAKKRSFGKPVKVPFLHTIIFDWHRNFSLWERIQILFGYGIEVAIRIPTRHNPGEVAVLVMATTTPYDTARELLKDRAAEALKTMYGDQLPCDQ